MSENLSQIQYLYKYRSIDKNTKRIITDNELYFSSPADFNDPYDCNIPIEKNSSEENIRKHMLRNISESSEEELDRDVKRIKEDPNFLHEIIKKYLNDFCGICCFSKLYDSILMWSHYADYHKGICLKFDITKDPDLFSINLPVHYSRKLPVFDLFSCQDKIFNKLIQPKFMAWKYESEVRIFKGKKDLENNKLTNQRIFKFKNEALQEIIFGTNASEKDIKIIKKLCEKSDKNHVKFSKMQLKQEKLYGLEKVDL